MSPQSIGDLRVNRRRTAATSKRQRLFGLLLNALIMAVGASIFVPWANEVAGVLMIAGAILGMTMVSTPLRLVSGALVATGLAGLVGAMARGHVVDPGEVLSVNQALIGMIAAVSFLQLITSQQTSAPSLLLGRAAVWRTAAVVHLLGSIINITVVNSAGDHLRRNGSLSLPEALMISRAFSTGAFWSPFWAASGAALIYAPEARVPIVLVCGALLACAAIAFSSVSATRALASRAPQYEGFALSRELLEIPLAMVLLIVLVHYLMPDVPVIKLVLVASLAITVTVLCMRDHREAREKIRGHAARTVPKYYGELTLFASAGLLTVGLKAFLTTTEVSLPFSAFGVLEAWVSIVVMVALALTGVHPVVSMAVLAALMAQMDPNPTLFVLAVMIGWGCAICVGPLSGLLIHLNGRYGMTTSQVVRGNGPYVCFVVGAAYPSLLLCQFLLDI